MNISHLSKAAVLAALYNNSRVQGMGILQRKPGNMTDVEAQELLDANPTKYFDYLYGKVMKIDLSTDELDTHLYNRDLGQNAAEKVISSLK